MNIVPGEGRAVGVLAGLPRHRRGHRGHLSSAAHTGHTTDITELHYITLAGRLENVTFIFDDVPAPGPGSARRAVGGHGADCAADRGAGGGGGAVPRPAHQAAPVHGGRRLHVHELREHLRGRQQAHGHQQGRAEDQVDRR